MPKRTIMYAPLIARRTYNNLLYHYKRAKRNVTDQADAKPKILSEVGVSAEYDRVMSEAEATLGKFDGFLGEMLDYMRRMDAYMLLHPELLPPSLRELTTTSEYAPLRDVHDEEFIKNTGVSETKDETTLPEDAEIPPLTSVELQQKAKLLDITDLYAQQLFVRMFTGRTAKDIDSTLASKPTSAEIDVLITNLDIKDAGLRKTFHETFDGKTWNETWHALAALHFSDPVTTVVYAGAKDAGMPADKASAMLAPDGSLTMQGQTVVSSNNGGKTPNQLLGQSNIAQVVLDWQAKGYNYNECIVAALSLYRSNTQAHITALQSQYNAIKDNWFRGQDGVDRMMVLAQRIKELNAALNGTGDAYTTAELHILTNYVAYGMGYLNGSAKLPTDADGNRIGGPPDGNVVLWVTGTDTDTYYATKEAYIQAKTMGYSPDDVYIYSYIVGGKPIRLSDVVARIEPTGEVVYKGNLQTLRVADIEIAQLRTKIINYMKNEREDPVRTQQLRDELYTKLEGREDFLQKMRATGEYFSVDDSLNPQFAKQPQNIADQFKAIAAANSERKINVMGYSQGGALVTGFLALKDGSGSPYFTPDIQAQFGNYALLAGAQGGANSAQLTRNNPVFAWMGGAIPGYPGIVARSETQSQLAYESDYIQSLYRALDDPATRAGLMSVHGLEFYQNNEQVTTSVPLLQLPGTTTVAYGDGQHIMAPQSGVGGPFGTQDAGGRIVLFNQVAYYANAQFSTASLTPNLASDKNQYMADLNKGQIPDNIAPTNDLEGIFGHAGIIDPDVRRKVNEDLSIGGIYIGIFPGDGKYWPTLTSTLFDTGASLNVSRKP